MAGDTKTASLRRSPLWFASFNRGEIPVTKPHPVVAGEVHKVHVLLCEVRAEFPGHVRSKQDPSAKRSAPLSLCSPLADLLGLYAPHAGDEVVRDLMGQVRSLRLH